MATEFDYDSFNWSEHFKLDENSPTGLAWNKTSYSGNGKLEVWPGKPAGNLHNTNGYKTYTVAIATNVGHKSLIVSRIVASLHGMKIDNMVVDHLNGITTDNRVENLRVTTQAINCRNKKAPHNSPYELSGVTCRTEGDKSWFIGQFVKEGKNSSRRFSINKLGVMEAFKRAVIHRQNGIVEANLNGFEYSLRHCYTKNAEQNSELADVSTIPKTKQMRDVRRRKTNTSGYTGVCWAFNRNGTTTAIASYVDWSSGQPKHINKSFSTKRYGLLPAFAMAVQFRMNAIKMLNENGHGYSENHGK